MDRIRAPRGDAVGFARVYMRGGQPSAYSLSGDAAVPWRAPSFRRVVPNLEVRMAKRREFPDELHRF